MSLIVPIMKPLIGSSGSTDPGAGVTTLKTGLESCWELDETSGTTVYDSHGSNNGFLNSSSGVTVGLTGKVNNCYKFSTAYRYIATPIYELSSLTDLSVFLWYRTSALSNRMLVTKYNTAYSRRQFAIQVTSDSYMRVLLSSNGSSVDKDYLVDSVVISDGLWHHIGFTFSIGALTVYFDGAQIPLSKNSDVLISSLYNNYSDPVLISCYKTGAAYRQPANGYVDQVAMWSRAITAEEVAALYNSGNGLAYVNW